MGVPPIPDLFLKLALKPLILSNKRAVGIEAQRASLNTAFAVEPPPMLSGAGAQQFPVDTSDTAA